MKYSTRLLILLLTLCACVIAVYENGSGYIRQHVDASFSGIDLRIWSEYENAYSQFPDHRLLATRDGIVLADSGFGYGLGAIGPLSVDDQSQLGQIKVTSLKTGQVLLIADIETGRFQRKWW